MGLFDKNKLNGPVFCKDDSEAERQLTALQELRKIATGKAADAIEEEIRPVQAGIAGEKQVRFELENSHIPMYVLHDLYLEHEGLTAQIDFFIITRGHNFVIECKNLYGDIEINGNGDFIRTISYGRYKKREGIYSPITQNRRHLELIKQIRAATKNPMKKLLFEKNFFQNYRSVVVLANPKTVLNNRYAPKEIRDQVIRVDQLANYIRKTDSEPNTIMANDKLIEELAQSFLSSHVQKAKDYTEKYRSIIANPSSDVTGDVTAESKKEKTNQPEAKLVCPKCGAPMVKRKARRGDYIGNEFYGCSRYPQCRGIINLQ